MSGTDSPRPRRHDRLRAVLALVAALAVLAGCITVFSMRSAAVERSGALDRAQHSAAPSLTPAPPTAPVVTVISDEYSTAAELAWPTPEWPVQVARALDAKVFSLSSPGSGYAVQPQNYEFGGTFLAKASQVAPDSKVIVFFGGANDTRASIDALRENAVEAIRTAQRTAPDATIVVAGPVSTLVTPSAQVLRIRNTLREVAHDTDARWIDPIAGRWLSTTRGVVGADGQSLTKTGALILGRRFTAVIRPLLEG